MRRFWWLLAIAVPISLIASGLVVYQVEWGSRGPTIKSRHAPTYVASMQILVNSSANPYLRSQESPAGKALIEAANNLPFFIQSDTVAQRRTDLFGQLPGTVSAQALFARETSRGLNQSTIPIIQVTGFASSQRDSVRIVRGTVDAFVSWLVAEQQKAGIPRADRIIIEPLRSPTLTVVQQSSTGLAVLVLGVVLLGFVVLVYMLDRSLPAGASLAARRHRIAVADSSGDLTLKQTTPDERATPAHEDSIAVVGSAQDERRAGERRWA